MSGWQVRLGEQIWEKAFPIVQWESNADRCIASMARWTMTCARIKVVDRVFDAASDTFGMRLTMDNPGGKLPAGMDCKIRFDK